jgi:4-aminobutyrate aminotransferase
MSITAKDSIFKGMTRLNDVVVVSAEGCWMTTVDGRRLLDFTSGIGVTNTGHCHPVVIAAVQKQCTQVVHAQSNIVLHEPILKLTETLLDLVPPGLNSLLYTNSGSEAIENAIKLARASTGRSSIVSFQGGFHGRTYGAMSLNSSGRINRQFFGPMLGGVHVTPFPYEYHGITSDSAMKSLELLFEQQLHPNECAAVVIEPVLGEGGYVPAPSDFLSRVREFCTAYGILMIIDEVQSGFGRTGSYFACHSDFYGHVTPDILCMAKGIASGFPMGVIASRKELSDKCDPGMFGGTYNGHAVSCAAAIATQDVLQGESMIQNSSERGIQLRMNLMTIKDKYPHIIGDVRGLGCMVGVEFSDTVPVGTKKKVIAACMDNDLLVMGASTYEVIRFIPPLMVSSEEIDIATRAFEKAITKVFMFV